ncbi:unnamed protein product [Vitrella brassicaformis CCMP3155]|uniref:non-specific serine/threonine protein kinase n=1 Tax=Vitrella brassicaformis (strain CCMP3155) TaxID=1169540 RepID=A0A0G4FP86_VITBC|nr:unnamed protein product [Vitrella brassicaformis CCMP3155]|mmetsp:Transcript_30866/g.89819  ORF Transcript_30866/g.89819 Transcript_30866/m.89819 type:complete len:670 (+) Transcript_30866:193-2202(+)|eukprot:CEM16024.1 unnamed protein product [Vitrella brassicaformis CCMP3155]
MASPPSDPGGITRRPSCFILDFSMTGERVEQRYEIDVKAIGQGSYGSVCKARDRDTNVMRAIKTIGKRRLKNNRDIERFRREILLMKRMNHPSIVKLYEVYEDNEYIHLVLELCEGGDLFDRMVAVHHYSERDAALIMRQILSALHYCHINGIAHRDVKPENFLFERSDSLDNLKMIDFGLAYECRDEAGNKIGMRTRAGTPYYVAPEVLRAASAAYDEKCDLWSCGVVLFMLLFGYAPFSGPNDRAILDKVLKGQADKDPVAWETISEPARDLIDRLIQSDLNKRVDAGKALKHEWIDNWAHVPEAPLSPKVLSRMRKFVAMPALKKAALQVIASQCSGDKIQDLQLVFQNLDKNNDGSITLQEFREGLNKTGMARYFPDREKILKSIDWDGSGVIDYTEFVAAALDHKICVQEEVLLQAFRVFDVDGDGVITAAELRKVLMTDSVKAAWGTEPIEDFLKDVDTNHDGKIDFDEFNQMMKTRIPATGTTPRGHTPFPSPTAGDVPCSSLSMPAMSVQMHPQKPLDDLIPPFLAGHDGSLVPADMDISSDADNFFYSLGPPTTTTGAPSSNNPSSNMLGPPSSAGGSPPPSHQPSQQQQQQQQRQPLPLLASPLPSTTAASTVVPPESPPPTKKHKGRNGSNVTMHSAGGESPHTSVASPMQNRGDREA